MAEPRVELHWRRQQSFDATNPEGATVRVDGDAKSGLSPMQSLLAAVAGCMGVDVVMILEKMRAEPDGLTVRVEGDRRDEHPKRYTAFRLGFLVEGDVPRDKVERAVELSLEKYCSVFHTLREDVEISTEIEIRGL